MWMYNNLYSNELYHHGIKGMKQGVRRYQNKDGSLTRVGKKRVSKQYKKLAIKAANEVNTTENYLKAYNKTADKVNNGLIDKYNADYDKKLGSKAKDHDFGNDEEYIKGYIKFFNETLAKTYAQVLDEAYKSNKYYQEAQSLVEKHSMETWDDLAMQNGKTYRDMRSKYLND